MNAGSHRSQPLRRRLFAWFAVAIVLSAILGVSLAWVLGLLNGRHERHQHPIDGFIARQIALAWDKPAERSALLQDVATNLALGVRLRDASGAVLESHGQDCPQAFATVPVKTPSGATLGDVVLCPPRMPNGPGGPGPHPRGAPWFLMRNGSVLLLALIAMWAASGRVARLLARPLQELARVTDDLGQGKLTSRAALSSQRHGVDELDSLAHSINDMAVRIERQLHDQKELLAAVSHELRTPLGHAKLLIEMARDQPEDADALNQLEGELLELERMVGQLLASARLDFSALDRQNVDAIALAVRVLERTGVDAARLAVETDDTRVNGDPALLAQALANLVDNARRHGGQLIALRLRSADDMLLFEALDDGPGFTDGHAESAFEPFQRGPASHGGLGLGLTLVRRIAVAHAGSVAASNRPEGGACVTLAVPLVKSA